jgi:hypothetical protein
MASRVTNPASTVLLSAGAAMRTCGGRWPNGTGSKSRMALAADVRGSTTKKLNGRRLPSRHGSMNRPSADVHARLPPTSASGPSAWTPSAWPWSPVTGDPGALSLTCHATMPKSET